MSQEVVSLTKYLVARGMQHYQVMGYDQWYKLSCFSFVALLCYAEKDNQI